MGTSASKVHVWNRALSRIGETDRIQDEDEERLAAEVCRLHWDDIVKEVLARYPWPFARKQTTLAQPVSDWVSTTAYAAAARARYNQIIYTAQQSTTGDIPSDDDGTNWAEPNPAGIGWSFLYTVPSDCVTPLALLAEGERLEILPLENRRPFGIILNIEGNGRLLGCDLDSDDFDAFEYIALVEYIPMWSRTFVSAITYRIAVELALAVAKDENKASAMMAAYEYTISLAFSLELNGHQPDLEIDPPSVLARN